MGLLARVAVQAHSEGRDADVIVVNTCSFIESAQQESVNTIRTRPAQGGRIGKKLIVAGCLVERFRNDIQKNIPEVDAVVGTGELENILQAAGIQPKPRSATASPFNIITSRA